MHFVESNFVSLGCNHNLLLFLIRIDLAFLKHIDCIFLFLGLQKDFTGNYAVQQILQMFFGFACSKEKILLKLLIVLIRILFVNLH